MNQLSLFISITAIFNLTIVSIFSWIKSKQKPADFWLGWMFFAAGFAIFDNTLIYSGYNFVSVYHIALILNLVWGGYLISFVRALRQPSVKKIVFDHRLFLPVLLYIPFLVLNIFQPHWANDALRLARIDKMTIFSSIFNSLICIYSLVPNAWLLVAEYIRKDKFIATRRQHNRIREILWILLILQSAAFVPFLLGMHLVYIILYMPVFGQLFFLYVFFRIMNSSHIFYVSGKNDLQEAAKYSNLKLSEEKTNELLRNILNLMETEKPYLNTEYTLTEMAHQLNQPSNIISMIINSRLKCTFPDFINSYRIQQAMELMKVFHQKRLTIETVAYECGFNNRTSFYKAFKKQTGKLPSDFIKSTQIKRMEAG